jgi:ParB-like chromosome segregation protein Spo0J
MKNSKASSAKARYEQVPTAQLIPYARNARTHSEQQVAQIAASIREFGFINPVIIDANSGIIAGHGRVMAANLLKLSEVPCLRVEHLTDTQKRAYILADNKLALNAGWDNELLKIEIESLQEDDFDALLTGFSDDEMKAILSGIEFTPDLPDEDEDSSEEPSDYLLHVTCSTYEAQESLMRELTQKGFKVKAK